MRFICDHDLHIHSFLSKCSGDPAETPERMLTYAKENSFHTVCLTDHFWDASIPDGATFYRGQDLEHISLSHPLPKGEGIRFLFGCETDMNRHGRIGISKAMLDRFGFIVIPTTHFHLDNNLSGEQRASLKSRAEAWVSRFDRVMESDLPFGKVGLAHLTFCFIVPDKKKETLVEMLGMIPDAEMKRLFSKAAKIGLGIELNSCDMKEALDGAEELFRPYRIAKECGCRFYLGSDAHHPATLDAAKAIFEKAVDRLGLEESDKFRISAL